MDKGWIKLHRKILDNEHLFGKSYDFGIFVTLLLMADRKTGKLTIGRKQLAKRFRAKESTIYDALKRLEKQQQINIKTNNQFSEISIVKYHEYQTKTDNETKQKPTLNQQQTDTLQEVRIKKKEYISNDIYIHLKDKFPLIKESALKKEMESIEDYLLSSGKKYKDYNAFARNWIRRVEDKLPKKEVVKHWTPPTEINRDGLNKLSSLKEKYNIGGIK